MRISAVSKQVSSDNHNCASSLSPACISILLAVSIAIRLFYSSSIPSRLALPACDCGVQAGQSFAQLEHRPSMAAHTYFAGSAPRCTCSGTRAAAAAVAYAAGSICRSQAAGRAHSKQAGIVPRELQDRMVRLTKQSCLASLKGRTYIKR